MEHWALIWLLALLSFGCRPSEKIKSETPPVAAGTTSMVARLELVVQQADPQKNPFLNRPRAEWMGGQDVARLPLDRRIHHHIETGLEWLRAGDPEQALDWMKQGLDLTGQLPPEEREQFLWLLDRFQGICYLRVGELQNCVARHTSESCLFPIGPGGVHEVKEGSQRAITFFQSALARQPNDLGSLWLLNVAHMTLGSYPRNVPAQFLLPPELFASEYDVGKFTDIASEAGVAVRGLAGGVVAEDLDGDGKIDLLCSSWGLNDALHFFHNNGDGTFTDRTEKAGLKGLTGGLNLCHADYDNDGDRDVLVLRGAWLRSQGAHPNSLLRNRGDGFFEDVTEQAGLLSFHPTQAGAWADFDGDGFLDLFIGNETTEQNVHPCELYRNKGDGTFVECAAACSVANVGFVKGAAWGDYDNDGRPDLYLSRMEQDNVLYRNAGPSGANGWRFEDVTVRAGVAQPKDSFATWFWDYNNDGWLDLFVLSYSWQMSMEKVTADYMGIPNAGETPRLYRNKGDGTFEDVTVAAHLNKVLVAMGVNFGDLDNDGYLDCYLGTGEPTLGALMPNRMFRNAQGQVFQDVTTSGGFGQLQKGHAIAFADFDGDGDQDIYEVLGGAYQGDGFQNSLFRNPGHGNHWLTLRLQGVRSNRDAMGARVEAVIREPGGVRSIHLVVGTGGSFGSQTLQQEMGLGKAERIEAVKIRWPAGSTQVLTNVSMDQIAVVKEGS